ncbi:unnamed protein product, partial [Allacma fusca]
CVLSLWKIGITSSGKPRWIQYTRMVFTQMEDQMIAFNKAQNANKTGGLTSDSICGIVALGDIQGFSTLQLVDPSGNVLEILGTFEGSRKIFVR